MSTGPTSPDLIDWINRELNRTGLSGTRASERAGLNKGAISEIVNGRTPGLEVCKALAHVFGASPEYVLRMAGHLPPERAADNMLPETRDRIQRLADRIARLPVDRQIKVIDAIAVLTEVEAVADAVEEEPTVPLSERAEPVDAEGG